MTRVLVLRALSPARGDFARGRVYADIAVDDLRLPGLERLMRGGARRPPAGYVKPPLVERALDLVVEYVAFRQRSRPMRALILGHVMLAFDIEHRVGAPAVFRPHRAPRRHVANRAERDQFHRRYFTRGALNRVLRHRKTPSR